MAEHVADGVGLAFDPEFVAEFRVVGELVRAGFACVDDDVVVIWAGNRASRVMNFASEEVLRGN